MTIGYRNADKKFHPISKHKKVRKSRNNIQKPTGIKIKRKARDFADEFVEDVLQKKFDEKVKKGETKLESKVDKGANQLASIAEGAVDSLVRI